MKKIHSRPQLILYAFSGMGVNMLNLMVGSYLCSALLVGGFGEAVIPFQTYIGKDLVVAALWAVFALIAKVIDGVIDVPMAAFSDRLRTRWGRRRPTLFIGLTVMVAAYLLFLVVPQPKASVLNTVYYGVVLCLFYSFYTLTMVTYYATFTEIVETEKERTTLSNVKSVFDIVYFILGYVAVRMLLGGLNIRTVALLVLPLVATMIIPFFMIKEKPLTKEEAEQTEKAVKLIPSLRYTFKNKSFITWMCVCFFMTFGVQLFLGGINEYFSFVGMNMIFVMVAAFVPVPFTLMIYNHIKAKHGFGIAYRYTLICYAVGMAAMFSVGAFLSGGTAKTVLSIVAGLICSFAIGAMFAVAYSVPSQLAAEEQEKTGISNSAMYFAVQGLFSGVASGVGSGVVLTALKKASEAPDSSAMKYMTLISAAGILVALGLSFVLPRSILLMGKDGPKDGKGNEHTAD